MIRKKCHSFVANAQASMLMVHKTPPSARNGCRKGHIMTHGNAAGPALTLYPLMKKHRAVSKLAGVEIWGARNSLAICQFAGDDAKQCHELKQWLIKFLGPYGRSRVNSPCQTYYPACSRESRKRPGRHSS